jgi:hypothetical protein
MHKLRYVHESGFSKIMQGSCYIVSYEKRLYVVQSKKWKLIQS